MFEALVATRAQMDGRFVRFLYHSFWFAGHCVHHLRMIQQRQPSLLPHLVPNAPFVCHFFNA